MRLFSRASQVRLLSIFLVLILIHPAFDYTISGNTLTDLTSTTLASEASYWTLSSYVTPGIKVYLCGSTYILGGYNIVGSSGSTPNEQYYETTYTGLPSHNQINLRMTIYALDSWDGIQGVDEHFKVSFDGVELFGWTIIGYLGPYTSPICGSIGYTDYPPFIIKITFPHISSTLTLRLKTNFDESSINESLGFRDILMEFVYEEDPQTTMCGISSQPLPDKACPCSASNQYMSPIQSGTCLNCDATCATCNGGLSTNCLSCYPGNVYFKDFQCLTCDSTCATCNGGGSNQCMTCITNYYMVEKTCYPTCNSPLYSEVSDQVHCKTPCPGQYAYWDNSCSTTCPYPLLSTVVSSFSLCTFPCAADQYLYWNRTCSTKCEFPYEIVNTKNRLYCLWPCAKGEYIYWDNTCGTTCDPPLVKYSTGSPIVKDFCAYPCDPDKYLYWNGTCADYCESPFVASPEHKRKFCSYPCLLTQYLYSNGSCLDSCSSPFTLRIVEARSYCDSGCGNPLEYLYWNKTCGSCDSPLIRRIEGGKRYCDPGCPIIAKFIYWDNSCQATCPLPFIQSHEGSSYSCVFPCGQYQYLYWNGSCKINCLSPYSPRTANQRLFCDFPCDSSEYSYWNGTCASTCPQPFSARFEGNPPMKYCDFPCSEWEYLRWDGTCGTCNSPNVARIANGKRFCDLPCAGGRFTFWDGSCQELCNFPLVKDIQWGFDQKFCRFPCTDSQYLYWNGTCRGYCNAPYVQGTVANRKTCNYQCLNSEFLYYNSTCLSSCSLPLISRNEFTKNYCDYPCKNQEYLAWDGTCQKSCDSPYIVWKNNGAQFCQLPCETTSYYYPDSLTCQPKCSYPYKSELILPYRRCLLPINPDFATAEALNPSKFSIIISFMIPVKTMQYLRYLNIEDMHPNLERVSLNEGSSIFSTKFGIQPNTEMQTKFWRYISLDDIYLEQNLKPSFLINYWNTFTTLLIFIVIGVVCFGLEKVFLFFHLELGRLIFERLRIIMVWNFPIMVLANNIDEIILFTALEFQTLVAKPYNSALSTLSFVICVIFLGSIIGLIFLSYSIAKRENSQDSSFNKKKFQSCQIIHKGFQKISIVHQMFFVFYMMRTGLPMIIAVCCINQPFVCSLFQVNISAVVLRYITKNKPFKKRVNYYQIIIYEIGVFIMNLLVCLYTLIKGTGASCGSLCNFLATSVLAGTVFLNIMTVVFMVTKSILEAVTISREMNKQGIKGAEKHIAFLQIMFLFLQAGNMGFEELISYKFSKEGSKGKVIFPVHTLTERSFLSQESLKGPKARHQKQNLEYSFSVDQGERGIILTEQGERTIVEDEPIIVAPRFLPSEKHLSKPVKEEVLNFQSKFSNKKTQILQKQVELEENDEDSNN